MDKSLDTSAITSMDAGMNAPAKNARMNTQSKSLLTVNTQSKSLLTDLQVDTNTVINVLIDKLIIQFKPDQKVKPAMGFLRFYLLSHIFNRQTILSGKYSRDLRQGFCLLLYDRLSQSITSPLRVLFPSAEGIAARYKLLPHSRKIYLYYCLNPFLIIYWLLRGLVVKSSDADGLGTLLGPISNHS
jgi:hypothetical protein